LKTSASEKDGENSPENLGTTTAMLPLDSNNLKPSTIKNEGEQIQDSSETALPKSSPDSEEVVENKINVERSLEQVSSRCTDPILLNFASYSIVIPMSELPNRKLLCWLQLHSPYQIDWYTVSFAEYVRDEEGYMGSRKRNKRIHHKGLDCSS
jgi:hypothetical protein